MSLLFTCLTLPKVNYCHSYSLPHIPYSVHFGQDIHFVINNCHLCSLPYTLHSVHCQTSFTFYTIVHTFEHFEVTYIKELYHIHCNGYIAVTGCIYILFRMRTPHYDHHHACYLSHIFILLPVILEWTLAKLTLRWMTT